jgi:hypothetical protein
VGSLVNTDGGIDLKLVWDKSFDSALADLIGVSVEAPATSSEMQTPTQQGVSVTTQDVINQLNDLSQQFEQMKDTIDTLIKSIGGSQ